MKNNGILTLVLIVAAVAVGAYYFSQNKDILPTVNEEQTEDAAFDEEFAAVKAEEEAERLAEQQSKLKDPLSQQLKEITQSVYLEHKGGSEEEAVNALVEKLGEEGFSAEKWSVISPQGEKLIVVVKAEDESFKHLDPYNGVIPVYDDQVLLGPYAARFLISGGRDYNLVFKPLDADADISFYKEFAHVMMAPPGEPVHINIAAPVYQGEDLVLGEVDGQPEDVSDATSEIQLTPYLNYIGQKHGETVKRRIFFTDPARVTLTLVKPYDETVMKANIDPVIEGNSITFDVPAEEALILDDLSPDFIDIDQIIIKPL